MTEQTTPHLAYRTTPGVTREHFIAAMQAHQDADRVVQGTYWDDGRGCSVGCGVQTVMALTGQPLDADDHAALAEATGVPELLHYLQDRIFEGLPADVARGWPVRFASAIPDGADLSGVWRAFAPWLLREIALPAAGANERVRVAIINVADAIEAGAGPERIREVRQAAAYAYAAADVAAAAAAHAAASASSAASSAYAAAASADAAAYAHAHDHASYDAAYILMADRLCDFLAAAPVGEG